MNLDTDRMQSEGNPVSDPTAGFTRVLADDHSRFRVRTAQIMAECPSDQENTVARERKLSGDAANAVRTKELASCSWYWVWNNECSGLDFNRR